MCLSWKWFLIWSNAYHNNHAFKTTQNKNSSLNVITGYLFTQQYTVDIKTITLIIPSAFDK